MHRRHLSRPSLLFLALALCSVAQAASQPQYLRVEDIAYQSILQTPAADNSPKQQAEVQTLLDWQNKRSKDDEKRCQAAAAGDAFYFSNVIGSWFDEESHPITAKLLKQAGDDAGAVKDAAKNHFDRKRPYDVDPRIQPCVPKEKSPGYPSGHATRGIVWATILAEMFPEHRDALLAAGKQYGDDRFIGGVHYPSDVKAGQQLGAEIARQLLANPQFQKDLEQAKEECLSPAAH
jgi:hypothetical protein